MISTKQDLQRVMAANDACRPFVAWVDEQEGTAQEIWLRCQEHGWLIQLAGRLNREAIVAFAQRCADQVKNDDGPWRTAVSPGLVDDGTLRKQCVEAARGACEAVTALDATTYARLAASIAVCARRAKEHEQLAEMHALWPKLGLV